LADAEAEQHEYLLTGQAVSLTRFENACRHLDLEFSRLGALVHSNPVESREVERIRDLVQQQLNELQRSIGRRAAAGSRAGLAKILTAQARKLTNILHQSIYAIDRDNEGTLARLARKRRVRLASALAAVGGALLLAGSYLFIGGIVVARSA